MASKFITRVVVLLFILMLSGLPFVFMSNKLSAQAGANLSFPFARRSYITQDYDPVTHPGIDYRAITGTPVVAARNGVITRADNVCPCDDCCHDPGDPGYNTGYANLIEIDHGNGIRTRYAHLSPNGFAVVLNQNVYRGQQIANSDNTGHSDAAHLHFELRVNGNSVDPYPDAWVSGSPIPMGYRDQDGTVHGPYALDDTKIHDKWLALNGGPGAPIGDDSTSPCSLAGAGPQATFRIQRFERGYVQYCGSANADYIAYGKTYLPDTKIVYNNWISSLAMHADGLSSKVGLYFYKPDGTVADSRVYDSGLAQNALWVFDSTNMATSGGEWLNPVDPVAGSGVVAAELNVSAEAINHRPLPPPPMWATSSPPLLLTCRT